MTVRPYTRSDQAQVIDLWRKCGLTTTSNNPKRDIERKLDENPELFLVYECEKSIIGSCMAGYDGHRGWLYYLGVRPGYRKQGVATALIKEAEKRLLKLGCPKIDLMVRKSNSRALAFYHTIGYELDPVIVLSKRLYDDEPYAS